MSEVRQVPPSSLKPHHHHQRDATIRIFCYLAVEIGIPYFTLDGVKFGEKNIHPLLLFVILSSFKILSRDFGDHGNAKHGTRGARETGGTNKKPLPVKAFPGSHGPPSRIWLGKLRDGVISDIVF